MVAECWECGEIIGDGYDFGDIVECPRCGCLYIVGDGYDPPDGLFADLDV